MRKIMQKIVDARDCVWIIVTMDDGSVFTIGAGWVQPPAYPNFSSTWIEMVGTEGSIIVDDTHRDVVLTVDSPQSEGYAPDNSRLVDFIGSYPLGHIALGELRGPMREETMSWLLRLSTGMPTHHASAAEAHSRLLLTKALDLSARRRAPVQVPLFADAELDE